jgi:hypothetical protein
MVLEHQFRAEAPMTNLQRRLQVFVSSTFQDLQEERQTAVAAILESGHIPAGMELFAAGNQSQMKVIERWIDESDILMLLLGRRYGSVEKSSGLSYTEREYEYAATKGKPVFAVVLGPKFIDTKIRDGASAEAITERDEPDKYRRFYERVTSNLCKFANDHSDIRFGVMQSIYHLEKHHEFVGWISGRDAGRLKPQLELPTGLRDFGKVMHGKWRGTTTELDPTGQSEPIAYDITWDFQVSGDHVTARSTLAVAGSGSVTDSYVLTGRVLYDRFVRIEYFNDNKGEVNFGTEILQVSDDGKRFVGRFVGYGAGVGRIISGVMEGAKEE